MRGARLPCAMHRTAIGRRGRLGSSRATAPPLKVFLIAGEASGDTIGARLMCALRTEHPSPVTFEGIGGASMEAQGLRPLFPMADLSVMGFAELLPALPRLTYRLSQTLSAARDTQPNLVVGIDSKGFCLRVLRALSADRAAACTPGPVLAQYVAPSAWAFADAHSRARQLAGCVDELLLLLPFEEPLYRAAGVPCTFVGHPSIEDEGGGWWRRESEEGAAEATLLRSRFGVGTAERALTLLPGSRHAEVRATLPPMLDALGLIARELERKGQPEPVRLSVFLPAVQGVQGIVKELLHAHAPSSALQVHVIDPEERRAAYRASELALACCGTVNVELALSSTPQVALWRSSWLTHLVIRRILRPSIAHASLPNILALEACTGSLSGPPMAQPLLTECLFDQCAPEPIAAASLALLESPNMAAAQTAGAQRMMRRLGVRDSQRGELLPPSTLAARALLSAVARRVE